VGWRARVSGRSVQDNRRRRRRRDSTPFPNAGCAVRHRAGPVVVVSAGRTPGGPGVIRHGRSELSRCPVWPGSFARPSGPAGSGTWRRGATTPRIPRTSHGPKFGPWDPGCRRLPDAAPLAQHNNPG
jgi:hypothetical protein